MIVGMKGHWTIPVIAVSMIFMATMMIIPAQIEPISNDLEFVGYLTLVTYDENGNNVFTQTIHNQLVDTGEAFLLQQVFQDGSFAKPDNVQIGSICLTDETAFTSSETMTAAEFDTANTITETNCIEDTAVDIVVGQIAEIGPLTFSAGTHLADGDTITGVGICQNDVTNDLDFNNCTTEGILFAAVDIADVTLNAGETAQITYTFDMSSPAS